MPSEPSRQREGRAIAEAAGSHKSNLGGRFFPQNSQELEQSGTKWGKKSHLGVDNESIEANDEMYKHSIV